MNIDEIIRECSSLEDIRIRRMTGKYSIEGAKNCIMSLGSKVCGKQFVIDDSNESTILNIVAWLMNNNFEAISPTTKGPVPGRLDKGIYLYGGTGTGKTALMDALRIIAQKDHLSYDYGLNRRNMVWSVARADDIAEEFMESGSISRWVEENCLLIDDLGAEPREMIYMGNRVNVLKRVLEARGDRKGIFTIILSNIPLGRLSDGSTPFVDCYGNRVESRIMEMCNYLYLGGEDRRKV